MGELGLEEVGRGGRFGLSSPGVEEEFGEAGEDGVARVDGDGEEGGGGGARVEVEPSVEWEEEDVRPDRDSSEDLLVVPKEGS